LQRVGLAARHTAALTLLAGLVLLGQFFREQAMADKRGLVQSIELVAEQRVLAAQVGRDLVILSDPPDSTAATAVRARLWRALGQWDALAARLSTGDVSTGYLGLADPELAALASSLGPQLARARAALSAGDLAAGRALDLRASATLTALAEGLTQAYADASDALIEAERLRVVLLLFVLLGLGLFVFDPAVQAIRANTAALRERNAALDVALAQAASAARIKDEFLATTSHELRTPLNAVIGLSGLLRTTPLDARQQQFIETINASGENLLQLINDILDLSKMDAGKLELEQMDFELRDVVETAVEALALRAEHKRVELGVVVMPGTPEVLRGDAGRLGQVLLNFLSNALKFTEQGSVLVTAQAAQALGPQGVRLAVSDTGIGISAEAQARLFQPFSQADSSTTRKYGGTGLGLSISRRLIELMGGRIGVTSVPGRGSTFWVEVPFTAPEGTAISAPVDPARTQGVPVLIVDDLAANRLVLSTLLEGWGMEVLEAESAPAALALLRERRAAGARLPITIIDWQMPGMDGDELAAAIHADPALSPTRLILLSSFSRGHGAVGEGNGPYDEVLAKPVRQRPLWRAITAVLDADAAREASGADAAPATPALPRFAGARVLVVDDNPVNTLVAKAMLEPMGVRVDTAGNGYEALDAMATAEGDYDLILMDVQMPEMDGRTATTEIRKRYADAPRRVPIVAVTAAAMPEDRALCLAAGMDEYVTKPIPVEVMIGTCTRWLTR
jgi:two-component system, sensor histidine kinase and response regulator